MCTCSYNRVGNVDVLGIGNMNPISIGACLRGSDSEIRSFNIPAFLKREVHLLCILDLQVLHYQILAICEGYCLYPNVFPQKKNNNIIVVIRVLIFII